VVQVEVEEEEISSCYSQAFESLRPDYVKQHPTKPKFGLASEVGLALQLQPCLGDVDGEGARLCKHRACSGECKLVPNFKSVAVQLVHLLRLWADLYDQVVVCTVLVLCGGCIDILMCSTLKQVTTLGR
jgi:hypothetical protein